MFPLDRLRADALEKARRAEERDRAHPPEPQSPKVERVFGPRVEPSLEKRVKLFSPRPGNVTSPVHLAVLEQLRNEHGLARSDRDAGTAVDVFVLARGE